MTEGSLFAGIMGFGEGFRRAGFKNLWAVEKEPFCQKVIRARFPETEIFDDVKECGKHNLGAVDVLTAGFPCQDLSVAGKRAGLDGARSGLFWEVVRILGELRPTWFVLENVPGLFSSCEGRDFAVVLNALDELGYGLAWRVLNSQFFGVAQRRRRVFIVGRFGKPCPRAVLFEPEGRGGDIETRGEAWPGVAAPIGGGADGAGRLSEDVPYNIAAGYHENLSGNVAESNVARAQRSGASHSYQFVAAPITASYGKQLDNSDRNGGPAGDEHHNHIAVRTAQTGANGIGVLTDGTTHTLDGTGGEAICGTGLESGVGQYHRIYGTDKPIPTLQSTGSAGGAFSHSIAYERSPSDSHGMRDFTRLPKGLDSARYRALGNAVTVSVAEWIGRRILEIDHEQSPCVGQGK